MLFLCAILYSFKETGVNPPRNSASITQTNAQNDFIIGVLESGADPDYSRIKDSLGLNLWHRYNDGILGWRVQQNNWAPFDSLLTPYSRYGGIVKDVIQDNEAYGLYTMMQRVKMEYLSFGQRSDYQCETEDYLADRDYWFYTYNTVSDNVSRNYTDTGKYGKGARVRYCRTLNSTNAGNWVNSPGYVVKDLKSNREQINCLRKWGVFASDTGYSWYVKPKIRIDSAFANIASNSQDSVCRIDILNFNGALLKSKRVLVEDFLNIQNAYDGNYFEDSIKLDPEQGEKFNESCEDLWDQSCAVDFRVYWYGKCDMWIDYVRVDNEIAHDLLSSDTSNSQYKLYQNWFNWEVDSIADQYPDNIYKFYIEEFEFNQIPCMAYVNRMIDSLSEGKYSLMFDLNYNTYKIHAPDFENVVMDANYLKRTLYDRVGAKEIFMGAYPILGDDSEISSKLNSEPRLQ